MDAFLYLQVRPGAVEDVVVQLENARGVRAAVAVIGDWDVLAATHGPEPQRDRRGVVPATSTGSTASTAR